MLFGVFALLRASSETNGDVLDLQGSVELGGVPPSFLSAGGTEVKSEHVSTQVSVLGFS